jgi:tryptophan synthase
MEKGVGGRIEDAFQASKAKGEAAFVTFITAGYPTAQGTSLSLLMFTLV